MLGGAYGRRVTVVTGGGNNGADGRVAARRLRRLGIGVDEMRLDPGFGDGELARAFGRADLVIDAMFGTGFRGGSTGRRLRSRRGRARHPPRCSRSTSRRG